MLFPVGVIMSSISVSDTYLILLLFENKCHLSKFLNVEYVFQEVFTGFTKLLALKLGFFQ